VQLVEQVGEKALVLNIGSGKTSSGRNVINLDIDKSAQVHVVGDAMALPIQSDAVDGVIISNVLEHVREPEVVVAEIYRVLKAGGLAYVEVPFLVPYHPHPFDFQRYTLFGLRQLCRNFEVIDEGVVAGPGSSLAQILRMTLAAGFSLGNELAYKVFARVFGWLVFPIKYIDILFERNPMTVLVANAHFLVLRKRAS